MKKHNKAKHKSHLKPSTHKKGDSYDHNMEVDIHDTHHQKEPSDMKGAGSTRFQSSNFAGWAKKIMGLSENAQTGVVKYKSDPNEKYVRWPK